MDEQEGKPNKPKEGQPESQKQGSDWLQSAINSIHSETKDDLENQATINKMDFQTTISRAEYKTSNLPTDRIIKRTTERNLSQSPANNPEDIRFRFLYSLTGLLLGSALCLAGFVVLIHGIYAAHAWLDELLGLSPQQLSDILPGVAMVILGILLIFITRQKAPHT